jgi:hypothetical protein
MRAFCPDRLWCCGVKGKTRLTTITKPTKPKESLPMSCQVIVSFSPAHEYEFPLNAQEIASLSKDEARAWLARQFEELECTPTNPMGKVLVLDMILNVAKYGGQARFESDSEWARTFVRACAATLSRPVITINIPQFTVG